MVGYQIFRNGTQIGTSTGPSYVDTTTLPLTAYNYNVIALDGAGNPSTSSNIAPVTTPAPNPVPHFYTGGRYLCRNRTFQPAISVQATQTINDNSPVKNMLLKFTVSGVGTRSVLSAKLKLYCVNNSPVGGEFIAWQTPPGVKAPSTGIMPRWRMPPVLPTLGKVAAFHLVRDGCHFAW